MADPDVVTKGHFAVLAGVSASRVSHWIAEGKLSGDALVGQGRRACIRVSVATAQLQRRLDPVHRLGSGRRAQVDGPAGGASEPARAEVDGLTAQIARERLEQLQRANRKAAEEELVRAGRLVVTDEADRAAGRIAGRMVATFETWLPALASSVAGHFNLQQRDVLHLVRSEFRTLRAAAAEAARREALKLPRSLAIDIETIGAQPKEEGGS